jgi:hypothetical protein
LNATNGITKSSNLFDHAIFVRRGCPALIFGWCNINRQLEAYQLVPHIQTRVIVNSNRVDPSEPVAIGAGIEQFTKLMEELRGGADRFGRTARLPLLAVHPKDRSAKASGDAIENTTKVNFVSLAT